MDNYIVSARKYRPKTFEGVIAQHSITSTLKNAIRNEQLAQAFLFCGPRGVGKTTCARILAKTINCENLSENLEACGQCRPCLSYNEYASFNIHELDAASNNSVEDIRSLVEQVRIPPQAGKYKVYIIDEVHMLSANAFNAFLKTLEEPPAFAKFILATTEKHKIIPTILSRCQIYDFKRIGVEEIVKHLEYVAKNEGIEAEHEALHIIAQKADGALRDALTIFDQLVSFSGTTISYQNVINNLNVLDYDYFFQLSEYIISSKLSDALILLHEIISKGFDGQHIIIGLGEHLRNLLVCTDEATISLLEVSPNIRGRYKEQASLCKADFLINCLEITNKCDVNYKSSNNKRLLLELTIMQMCGLTQQQKTPVNPNVSQQTADASRQTTVSSKQPAAASQQSTVSSKQSAAGSRQPAAGTQQPTVKTPIYSIKPKLNVKSDTSVEEVKHTETINDFSAEQLSDAWKTCAERYEKQHPGFFATLTKYPPEIKENFLIELKLDNLAQEEELKEKKTDIVGFLRKELKNDRINLMTSIIEITHISKPYTSSEKFNRLIEKNPKLGDLKNQLGLDID